MGGYPWGEYQNRTPQSQFTKLVEFFRQQVAKPPERKSDAANRAVNWLSKYLERELPLLEEYRAIHLQGLVRKKTNNLVGRQERKISKSPVRKSSKRLVIAMYKPHLFHCNRHCRASICNWTRGIPAEVGDSSRLKLLPCIFSERFAGIHSAFSVFTLLCPSKAVRYECLVVL